ncbi:hypothetical protein IC757_01505 [Wenzhouxiangella sp. AB-CW3]|uniref:hypothetical protein n=1 Tax=Wenzhouxiangella sp. AB-CW3 TaxID=2771012 RepID=UPI00168B5181|nr:hypothetical protein [Wenzhouxiangella sp. AB-CW3]QOC22870.1 hypothetical protein IC757_01505 [Wenzhouxiangella sp. AB-CW3]
MPTTEFLRMLTLGTLLGVAAPAMIASDSAGLLNSERIEQKFGSYGIEVLDQTGEVRVATLHSREAVGTVTRTFAVTRFHDPVDPRLAEAHQRIRDGASIGATLAGDGWEVGREHIWTGELPAGSRLEPLMGEAPGTRLAVHVFDLTARRGGEALLYATIAEVHHPDHLDQTALEDLFGQHEAATDRSAQLLHHVLAQMGTARQ